MKNVNIKWDIEAKLYGTITSKLFTNINKKMQNRW